ncbi:MAG: transposase [Alphaproteobacteria bacterium]
MVDALTWIAWTGAPWRALPHDFPPWEIVCRQAMRWLAAGVFEAMVTSCVCCRAILPAATSLRALPFSTAAPCNPPRRAGTAPVMTVPLTPSGLPGDG